MVSLAMKSRLAVIMVADVVGYSRMMAEDEEASIVAVRDLNETYVRLHSTNHGGEILKRMGDGWIIAFGSVHAGISCALELLQTLSGNENLKIRIGAHIGEIVEDDEDFYGAWVNLASRLQGQAPPGGMMVSQDLFRQLTGQLAAQFEDAGSFDLKNIPYPVQGNQWRPAQKKKGNAAKGEVPTVLVEEFDFAPATDGIRSHAEELRGQILMNLSRRTGIKTIERAGDGIKTVYRMRGRLRVSGAKARMNVSMALCETGETLFSRNYDGDITDIFEFGDQISAKINADLRIQINAYEANRLEALADDELIVSELRSRAARNFYRATYTSWLRGLELMERAVELAPDDPMSLGMLAVGEVMLHATSYEPMPQERIKQLEDGLNLAIKQAPKVDFLYTARSNLNGLIKGDGDAALRDAENALALNPTYLIGFGLLATALILKNDLTRAIERLEYSMTLSSDDPLEAERTFPLAVCYYLTGQFDKARAVTEALAHANKDNRVLQKLLGMVLRELGDKTGAAKQEKMAESLTFVPSIQSLRVLLPQEHAAFADELYSVTRA
jgi:adenylate cyclase